MSVRAHAHTVYNGSELVTSLFENLPDHYNRPLLSQYYFPHFHTYTFQELEGL